MDDEQLSREVEAGTGAQVADKVLPLTFCFLSSN